MLKNLKEKINSYYKQTTSLYKRKVVFEIDQSFAPLLKEYFALRHVLEHTIANTTQPPTQLVLEKPEKAFALEKAAHFYKTAATELEIYNPWLITKGKKVPKDVAQYWLVPHSRQGGYPYPKLPKKADTTPPKNSDTPQKTPPSEKVKQKPQPDITQNKVETENGAEGKSLVEVLVVPPQVNVTDEIPHLHVVKKGESLFKIAQNYDISLMQLRYLNPHKKTSNLLIIGERLIIRARNMKEQMDSRREKNVENHLMRGAEAGRTFQLKMNKKRVYQQAEKSISPEPQRGTTQRYPARLSPIEFKTRKPYLPQHR